MTDPDFDGSFMDGIVNSVDYVSSKIGLVLSDEARLEHSLKVYATFMALATVIDEKDDQILDIRALMRAFS